MCSDGGSFTTNQTAPINVTTPNKNGNQLWFRGAENLAAAVDYLKKNHGMASADAVVVSGCSAGGTSTYLQVRDAKLCRHGVHPDSYDYECPWGYSLSFVRRIKYVALQLVMLRNILLIYFVYPICSLITWPPCYRARKCTASPTRVSSNDLTCCVDNVRYVEIVRPCRLRLVVLRVSKNLLLSYDHLLSLSIQTIHDIDY